MTFSNRCPISFEAIQKESGCIVKVPAPNEANEKDKYFYISDADILKKLKFCPFTRRQGTYFIAKLSAIDTSALLKEGTTDELIEDNQLLENIGVRFKWSERNFIDSSSHKLNAIDQHLPLTALGLNSDESVFTPLLWAAIVASSSVYLTLLAQNLYEAEYITDPENINANYNAAIQIGMISAITGGIEYLVRRSNRNSHGFFTRPIQYLFENNHDQQNLHLRR